MTLYEAIRPSNPTFEEPPPLEKIERVKLEYKVRMQEKQAKSARPKQRLQVKSVQNIQMPDVSIQVPTMGSTGNIGRFGEDNFGDLGDDNGLDVGAISVELFDIKAKGEKFLFVIDVERDLMQDSKGGLLTYNVIKEDLTELIMDLPSGVLFNVMLFDEGKLELWRPSLVAATKSNKESFAEWLKPVNSSPTQIGVRNRNYTPKSWNSQFAKDLLGSRWRTGNEVYLVAMGILEQKPDAVYLFSDYLPPMADASYRSEEDIEEAEKNYIDKIEDAGFDSVEEYRAQRDAYAPKIRKRVEAFKAKEAAERKAKGIPPRIYSRGENWSLHSNIEKKLKEEDDDYVPHITKNWIYSTYSEREVKQFFEQLMRLEYDQNSDERPVLNAIIFKGEDEDWSKEQDDAVDDFVDYFQGDYRVLKGLGAIDSEKFQ
ncbi:vWA domain-containing protein [Puniceicoccus vermicola]|uniref:Uncharacterized protein n=2 Tax=Puniceicoccus vermicola TaxID=388746 RepID=A0A7X1AZL6_9BACT|nr:hypothetical protein [Puniceicoccus vermicola]